MEQEKLSREQLEDKVRDLEKRLYFLESVFDAIPFNVFVKNTECKYCYTNKICDMLNGVERGALKGKTDFDLQKSREIAQSFYDDDMNIMASKKGSRMLSPTLCGSEIKYYDIFKEPVLDSDGNVMGIMGMVIDPNDSGVKNEHLGNDFEKYSEALGEDFDSFAFDYSIETGNTIILKDMESWQLFTAGKPLIQSALENKKIFEEDVPVLERILESVKNGSGQASAIVRFYDNDNALMWCRLALNTVLDNSMKPIRAVGLIRRIPEEVVRTEKMRIDVERVKNNIATFLGSRYDALIYVNFTGKSYRVLEHTGALGQLKDDGELEDLFAFFRNSIYDEDIPKVSKAAAHFIGDDPMENISDVRSVEFRFADNGENFRWKEADIFGVEDTVCRDILLTIFDVDDVVKEKQERKLKEINNGIIDILSTVVEFRSVESGDHVRRIKGFTKILLKYVNELFDDVNYTPEMMEVISSASAMHDVGKIAIPDSILLKPGRLTPEEYDQMKTHTVRGCEILDSMAALQDKNYYKYSYEICRYHHERYDGRGYPDGLKGEEIPIEAQIVAVADVYDALISKRVYKDAYSPDEAFRMITNGECGVFSERMMKAFAAAKGEMEAFASTQFETV